MGEVAEAIANAMAQAFQNLRVQPAPTVKLAKFSGTSQDGLLKTWLEDLDAYCRQLNYVGEAKAIAIRDHLTGAAREEVAVATDEVKKSPEQLIKLLKLRFGEKETLASATRKFHDRVQLSGESLADYSRALLTCHAKMMRVAQEGDERNAVNNLKNLTLITQFEEGVTEHTVRQEIKKMKKRQNITFDTIRDEIIELFGDTKVAKTRNVSQVVETSTVSRSPRQIDQADGSLSALVQGQQVLQSQLGELIGELRRMSAPNAPVKPEASQLKTSKGAIGPCWHCGEMGHYKKDCPKRKAELAARSSNQEK